MQTLLRTTFTVLLLSHAAEAAVCIGKNCELLDGISSSKGVPLQTILDNIQQNIIDPIVVSQSMMASWQGGMIDYSPAGAEGGVKVTLWGGASVDNVLVRGNFFGANYSSGYKTGIGRTGISVEVPISESSDLVLNGTFWKGPSDFGTGYLDLTSDETTVRLGAAVRTTVLRNSWSSATFSAGAVIGRRDFVAVLPGSSILIRTPLGAVGWQGPETYEESTSFVSLPATVGGRVNAWGITLLGEAGARVIGQVGEAKVQKLGPVGPFFGNSGFFNIGVSSDRKTDSLTFWPVLRAGAELKTYGGVSLMGGWQPKLGDQAQSFTVGLGLQLLRAPRTGSNATSFKRSETSCSVRFPNTSDVTGVSYTMRPPWMTASS